MLTDFGKGQSEAFKIFAEAVRIIGGSALGSGYRKEFLARFGTAFTGTADFHDPFKLAEVKLIEAFKIITAQKFCKMLPAVGFFLTFLQTGDLIFHHRLIDSSA